MFAVDAEVERSRVGVKEPIEEGNRKVWEMQEGAIQGLSQAPTVTGGRWKWWRQSGGKREESGEVVVW